MERLDAILARLVSKITSNREVHMESPIADNAVYLDVREIEPKVPPEWEEDRIASLKYVGRGAIVSVVLAEFGNKLSSDGLLYVKITEELDEDTFLVRHELNANKAAPRKVGVIRKHNILTVVQKQKTAINNIDAIVSVIGDRQIPIARDKLLASIRRKISFPIFGIGYFADDRQVERMHGVMRFSGFSDNNKDHITGQIQFVRYPSTEFGKLLLGKTIDFPFNFVTSFYESGQYHNACTDIMKNY